MLIKADKILTNGNVLMDKSPEEVFRIVRTELAQEVVNEMFRKGLFKTEMRQVEYDDIGMAVKVSLTVRAYNPDD